MLKISQSVQFVNTLNLNQLRMLYDILYDKPFPDDNKILKDKVLTRLFAVSAESIDDLYSVIIGVDKKESEKRERDLEDCVKKKRWGEVNE